MAGRVNKQSRGRRSTRKGRQPVDVPALNNNSSQAANRRSHDWRFRRALTAASLRRVSNPFPSSWRMIMTTNLKGYITSASAATGSFQVAANSIFTPWNVGTITFPNPIVAIATLAPAGFTPLLAAAGPYIAFRVMGSSIRVQIASENNADAYVWALAPFVGTDFASFAKASQSRWAVNAMGGIGKATILTNHIATTDISGDDPAAITQTGFAGAYNGSPSFLAQWSLWYSGATTTSASIPYDVSVSYDVVLENPQYDQSLDDVALKRLVLRRQIERDAELDRIRRIEAQIDASMDDTAVTTQEDTKTASSSLSSSSKVTKRR